MGYHGRTWAVNTFLNKKWRIPNDRVHPNSSASVDDSRTALRRVSSTVVLFMFTPRSGNRSTVETSAAGPRCLFGDRGGNERVSVLVVLRRRGKHKM